MNPRYASVALRAEHRCEYCRAPEVAFNFKHEVEHILPPQQGGTHALENLALACRSCNLFKGDKTVSIDALTGQLAPIFNPRLDEWQAHFAIDVSGEIRGLTPTGRATIALLNLNSTDQLRARRYWVVLGLFP